MYGAHRIGCHSAFKHYNMFHEHCSGGNNYGSIFNVNVYGNGCGGGSFWSGFGHGLGAGFGSLFGGFFGGFMSNIFGGFGNMFGGFNMGGMFGGCFPGFGGMFGGAFGNFGNFGNFGGNYGNFDFGGNGGLSGLFGGRKKKTGKSGNTKTPDDTNNDPASTTAGKAKECEDKDIAKHNELRESLNNLKAKPNPTSDEIVTLYNEVKKLADKPLDDSHSAGNKKTYELLLKNIEDAFNITKDGNGNATSAAKRQSVPSAPEQPASPNDNGGTSTANQGVATAPAKSNTDATQGADPEKSQTEQDAAAHSGHDGQTGQTGKQAPWTALEFNTIDPTKISEPAENQGITNGKGNEVTNDNFEKTEDHEGGIPKDVQGAVTVDTQKYGDTNFPLHISIVDKTDGKTYTYKCIGTTSNLPGAYAVYTTPSNDTNKNVYHLVFQNGKFKLTQKFLDANNRDSLGYNKRDTQAD